MYKSFLMVAIITIAGCTTGQPVPSQQAVEDFVIVSELQSMHEIRHFDQLGQQNLNDHYVIMTSRKQDYLVEFVRRCYELNETTRITPDVRHERNVIRAKFDTIRGCRIKAIYEINKGQAEELKSLGDAPGETLEIEGLE